MACESCGAIGWGSMFCITCLRFHKRKYGPNNALGLRKLIKILKRKGKR